MKKTEDIEVGKRIREIRTGKNKYKKNFGQKEFAKLIGSTVSALSNWENGRNKPNYTMLKTISDLADITVDELLLGTLKDIIYSIMNDVVKLKRLDYTKQEVIRSKEEELLTEITRLVFLAITNRQINDSNYWRNDIDFESLSDFEKKELIRKRKIEEQEIIQHLINLSVSECEEKNVNISDRITILECMNKAISMYAYRQEHTTEGLLNFLHSELDLSLMKAVEYVYLPNTDKKRDTIDDEISEQAYAIVADAMDKLNELKR